MYAVFPLPKIRCHNSLESCNQCHFISIDHNQVRVFTNGTPPLWKPKQQRPDSFTEFSTPLVWISMLTNHLVLIPHHPVAGMVTLGLMEDIMTQASKKTSSGGKTKAYLEITISAWLAFKLS